MSTLPPAVDDWLVAFERAVRERDFAAGRTLFASDAVGFGSIAPRYASLDALDAEQWRRVWPSTEAFTFDRDALVIGDHTLATVATTWRSTGIDPTGQRFERQGRVTLVLRRVAGTLRCVHSHYSLVPGTERVLR